MKCRKCGYISFDYNMTCPKCKKDISMDQRSLNLPDFEPRPPFLLAALTGVSGGDLRAESEVGEMTDTFVMEEPGEENLSKEKEKGSGLGLESEETYALNLGNEPDEDGSLTQQIAQLEAQAWKREESHPGAERPQQSQPPQTPNLTSFPPAGTSEESAQEGPPNSKRAMTEESISLDLAGLEEELSGLEAQDEKTIPPLESSEEVLDLEDLSLEEDVSRAEGQEDLGLSESEMVTVEINKRKGELAGSEEVSRDLKGEGDPK